MHSSYIRRGSFVFPPQAFGRPIVVIGKPGAGKTETLLRLAASGAQFYHYDVIYLDAKGDRDTATRFVAAMQQRGKHHVKVFPCSPYNGWKGDADALLNRLMAVQSFSEEYYKQMANLLLHLALNSPEGPPRSSETLLENLTLDRLRVLYRGTPEEAEIERITPKDANGVYNRYRAFFKMLKGKLDQGFTFDETDAAYILLDGIAFREETSSIGRYIVEDIAHYIARRKEAGRKVLIIIDEVSALAIENIANLNERLRSFGGAMILSSQSEQGLAKTQDERDRILGTTHTLFLHTCNTPERLITYAGRRTQFKTGWSTLHHLGTGYGTMQVQEEPIVAPDKVRRLGVGEVYVILEGNGYHVCMLPIALTTEQRQQAEAFLFAEEAATNMHVSHASSQESVQEKETPPEDM